MLVVGVDAAGAHGWVGVAVDDDGFAGAAKGSLVEVLGGLSPKGEAAAVVGIDIPIGTSMRPRVADAAVRARLGPRASSLFATPPTDVLDASDYAAANGLLAARGAPKISRQAWNLVPKMTEAAELAAVDDRLVEVHPELSFREMAGAVLPWSKKTWNGLHLRLELLRAAGVVVPDQIDGAGAVAIDDVVDAAAAAWSARRVARGEALSFPDPPEIVDGRTVAIWA